MVKSKKKQRIGFFFFKLIAFVALIVLLILQLKNVDWKTHSLVPNSPALLLFALLLVPLNWWFEWQKWKATIDVLAIECTPKTLQQSFFAGIITGMLTPNMLGNFIGRLFYFPRKYRISLILLTVVSNYAQFLASIVFGIIGILILQKTPLAVSLSSIVIPLILLGISAILLYFYGEHVTRISRRKNRIYTWFQCLNNRKKYRFAILLRSAMRHTVFTLQFLIVLSAFGESFSWENVWWVWQVYLWVTLTPSLFLGKLAIRESISIWVLSVAGMETVHVLLASLSIWIMNLLFPTLLSLFLTHQKT